MASDLWKSCLLAYSNEDNGGKSPQFSWAERMWKGKWEYPMLTLWLLAVPKNLLRGMFGKQPELSFFKKMFPLVLFITHYGKLTKVYDLSGPQLSRL